MAYTPIDKPSDFFTPFIWTGDGATTNALTGVGFQPDLVWGKCRSNANENRLTDVVRGVTKEIYSDTSAAEATTANGLKAFGSDGFTVGDNTGWNGSSRTYVSWNWKAGTSVSGDTTGSGTLKTYTGSVNTDAGFSIIKYTGNGTAGHTIPHHLGAQPQVVICKRLSSSGQWVFGSMALPSQFEQFLELDLSGAVQTSSLRWNDTDPSSSVFTVGSTADTNDSGADIIAYSFAEKQGYSKFGSYVGNANADGAFVYTGFKPAMIITKQADATNDWNMWDNKRNTYNAVDLSLYPYLDNAEDNLSPGLDFVSNGFKIRDSRNFVGASGGTFIYMAFAESPLTNSGFVPNNAR